MATKSRQMARRTVPLPKPCVDDYDELARQIVTGYCINSHCTSRTSPLTYWIGLEYDEYSPEDIAYFAICRRCSDACKKTVDTFPIKAKGPMATLPSLAIKRAIENPYTPPISPTNSVVDFPALGSGASTPKQRVAYEQNPETPQYHFCNPTCPISCRKGETNVALKVQAYAAYSNTWDPTGKETLSEFLDRVQRAHDAKTPVAAGSSKGKTLEKTGSTNKGPEATGRSNAVGVFDDLDEVIDRLETTRVQIERVESLVAGRAQEEIERPVDSGSPKSQTKTQKKAQKGKRVQGNKAPAVVSETKSESVEHTTIKSENTIMPGVIPAILRRPAKALGKSEPDVKLAEKKDQQRPEIITPLESGPEIIQPATEMFAQSQRDEPAFQAWLAKFQAKKAQDELIAANKAKIAELKAEAARVAQEVAEQTASKYKAMVEASKTEKLYRRRSNAQPCPYLDGPIEEPEDYARMEKRDLAKDREEVRTSSLMVHPTMSKAARGDIEEDCRQFLVNDVEHYLLWDAKDESYLMRQRRRFEIDAWFETAYGRLMAQLEEWNNDPVTWVEIEVPFKVPIKTAEPPQIEDVFEDAEEQTEVEITSVTTSGEELAVLSTSNDRKEVETAHRILYIPADVMAAIVEDKVEVVEEIT